MLSAKKALATINKENDTSINFKLRQVDKIIKAAKALGQDKVVLTYITDQMIDELYKKGYLVYTTHCKIKGKDYKNGIAENIDRIPFHIIEWKHAK